MTWTTRMRGLWGNLRKQSPSAPGTHRTHDDVLVASMLREIGIALLEVEETTHDVSDRLMRIAAQHTDEDVQVIALPTAVVIQVGNVAYEMEASTHLTNHLDMAGRVEHIANLAEVGAITPPDAIEAVSAARRMAPRFGPWLTIAGYAITTLGFGMVINPTWLALPGYAFLGAVVGAIVMATRPFPSLNPVLPTLAAMIVTILGSLLVADAANEGLMRTISPALVAMLPGTSLTLGAMELARTQMVAGAGRLVYGVVQLMLLVFGVSLGVAIAGPYTPQPPSPQIGFWFLYVAVVVIAVGLYVILSAPKGSLLWLAAAVGVALVGQRVGGDFLSPAHSGAIGAFLVVPFAMLASRVKGSPPAIVMKVAAFWSLVPGALSFVSLSHAATGGPAGIETLEQTVTAIFSIALGTLIGSSVFSMFDDD